MLTRLHYITLGTYDYVLSLDMFRLACIVAPWLLIQLHWGWVAHQEPPWCSLWYKPFLWKSVSFFHLTYCVRAQTYPPLPPHHANVCTFSTLCLPGSYIFVRLRRVTFKFGNFTNFKALFQVMSTGFPWLATRKVEKNHRRFLFIFDIHADYMRAWSSIQEKMTR